MRTAREVRRAIGARAADAIWELLRHHRAVGTGDRRAREFARFGAGTLLAFPPGDLVGAEHIALGRRTVIGPEVTLAVGMVPGQPLPPGATSPVLRIGDRCSIARGCHLVAATSVVVGDDVLFGPYAYVSDTGHAYDDPAVPVREQWPHHDPVVVGDGSWIGHGAVLLPGTRLGRGCVVAAGSVVRGEHPAHTVLAGAPARVVRRHDDVAGWDPPLSRPAPVAPAAWSDDVNPDAASPWPVDRRPR